MRLICTFERRDTGAWYQVSLNLNGTKHYKHLVKALKKANKNARLISYRVSS